MIKEEFEEKINNATFIEPNNNTPAKYFRNLSKNLHVYIIPFFTFQDIITILKLNRRFRDIILKFYKIFDKLNELRKYEEDFIPLFNYDYLIFNMETFKEMLNKKINFKEYTKNEKKFIIKTFTCNIYKHNQLVISCPTKGKMKLAKYILRGRNCKITKFSFSFPRSYREIKLKKIVDHLKEIITYNKSITNLQILLENPHSYYIKVFHSLIDNKSLKEIDINIGFSNKKYYTAVMPDLIRSLERNQSIEKFTLCFQPNFNKVFIDQNFNDFIENSTRIKELVVFGNFQANKNYFDFKLLKKNKSIEIFQINWMSPEKENGFESLSLALYQPINPLPNDIFNNKIHTLIMRFSNFCDSRNHSKYIRNIITNNRTITYLDLSNSEFNNLDFSQIFYPLASNTSLSTLLMKSCKLSFYEFETLLCSLETNSSLVNVDVSGNNTLISSEHIIQMFNNNKTLQTLNLYGNYIRKKEILILKYPDRIILNQEFLHKLDYYFY